MAENIYPEDASEFANLTDQPKKRKIRNRVSEMNKLIRVKNHKTGDPCNCKQLKCFENITKPEREKIIEDSKDEQDWQDAFLSGGVRKKAQKICMKYHLLEN